MDWIGWALYLLAAVIALAVAWYLYQRRETPGRGRILLAGLRGAALALLLLLLFDPHVPVRATAAGGDAVRVLVDGSLSMNLPAEPAAAETRWQRAVAEARRRASGRDVIVFGSDARLTSVAALDTLSPDSPGAQLLPALRLAAETGARRAVVVTDGALADATEAARDLARLGIGVEFLNVAGSPVSNLALAEVDAPSWAEAGEEIELQVAVAAATGEEPPATVILRQGQSELGRAEVMPPEGGGTVPAVIRFVPEAAPGGGLVRYELELVPGDAVPDDDRRTVYIDVSESPSGIALVSFRPDWEPRFLGPVLEEALGLPLRAFLHAGDGRYTRLAAGAEAGRVIEEAIVRRDVSAAELLVLHGFGPGVPDWAGEAARSGRRVLILPAADASGDVGLPLRLPPRASGDWYPADELPTSPIRPLLEGSGRDLPPVSGLRPSGGAPAGTWAPLTARRDARGAAEPLLLVGETNARRWAVALADGYWQWAFRGGEARRAYRSLWGGIAGWLAGDAEEGVTPAARPAERVAPRGRPLAWSFGGLPPDSLAVRLLDPAGGMVMDTLVHSPGDTARTRAVAPGHYRYEITVWGADGEAAESGELTVSSYSHEFMRPTAALDDVAAAARDAAPAGANRQPLHTRPWPFLLLALILSSEWVLRRRWGLR